MVPYDIKVDIDFGEDELSFYMPTQDFLECASKLDLSSYKDGSKHAHLFGFNEVNNYVNNTIVKFQAYDDFESSHDDLLSIEDLIVASEGEETDAIKAKALEAISAHISVESDVGPMRPYVELFHADVEELALLYGMDDLKAAGLIDKRPAIQTLGASAKSDLDKAPNKLDKVLKINGMDEVALDSDKGEGSTLAGIE